MSVQKIIAEADKLLEKGKVPEAVEKLKAALQAEPMNQLATTKLANAYADSGNKEKAAATFTALANRLSDAGKSQVAIAVFKQALEFTPNDIPLKLRYAQECESVNKVGDALNQAQSILQYYLRRKKFFDATNILPMLVRLNGKDDRLKQVWLEVMQYSQAEKKLVHLLVALCGPPGLVSEEFKVGGEPTTLSESMYEGLKRLVPFFPRDSKVAYAAAWCAYRRGKFRDFFHYLRECLRREPDFCLALLLFARVLAEREKLNEAYFVFKFLKERLAADKSVDDISTLNQLVEAFVQKNGWITFAEQTGDQLQTNEFLQAIQGQSGAAATAAPGVPASPAVPAAPEEISVSLASAASVAAIPVPAEIEPSSPAPAEIELGGGAEEFEIQHHSASRKTTAPAAATQPKAEKPAEIPPAMTEPEEGTMVATKQEMAEAAPVAPAPVEFAPQPEIPASATEPVPLALDLPAPEPSTPPAEAEAHTIVAKLEATQAKTMAEMPAAPDAPVAVAEEPAAAAPKPGGFNPLLHANLPDAAPAGAAPAPASDPDNQPTQIFSPMELIEVGKIPAGAFADVKTKIVSAPEAEAVSAQEPTQIKAPSEGSPAMPPEPTHSTLPSRTVGIPQPAGAWSDLKVDNAATELYSPMDVLKAQDDSRQHQPIPGAPSDNDPTRIVNRPEATHVKTVVAAPSEAPLGASAEDPAGALIEGAGVMPIPEGAPGGGAEASDSHDPALDLGDDLLDGATRILVAPPSLDNTQNLLKELQQEISVKEDSKPDPSLLMRKAERFIAKRNYYLARKALRHAMALGADEDTVKNRLRDIRKLEYPDSLYHAVSSDQGEKKVRSSEILERLEAEFEVGAGTDEDSEVSASVESKLEEIFQDNDPRTILDFGVGLHEMGLYRPAEQVFARIVNEYPDFAFDAYYLAAVSKFSRKDYAGAASILKKLSLDADRTELEKIQIYYALGELFEKMSQRDRSQEFFKKVAELDSNYRNIRHKLEG